MISVVDALSVPDAEFIFRMTDTDTEDILNSSWTLSKIENGDTVSVSSKIFLLTMLSKSSLSGD